MFDEKLSKLLKMNEKETHLGNVFVGEPDQLFEKFTDIVRKLADETNYPPGVALTGGSSPKAFYKWLIENPEKLPEAKESVVFTVSDERYVPIEDVESNFGNASRLFFDPFGVDNDNRFLWDTSRTPDDAADWYQKLWELSFGEGSTYDLCMLGMGDDCHTASLFPGSELLNGASDQNFASVLVPEKGDRLTVTPLGLEKCGQIVLLVMGSGKNDALKKVFSAVADTSVLDIPVLLMRNYPDKVSWLVDSAAAEGIDF